MKYKKIGDIYVIRLYKNEKIIETLIKFLEENKIPAAYLTAIGAVSEAELAHYDLGKKEYSYKTFKKPLEIISLIGNAALFNGKPMIHAHVSLSDDKMKVFGGHLKEATVSATCEVVLRAFDEKVARKEDLKIGLKLLDI